MSTTTNDPLMSTNITAAERDAFEGYVSECRDNRLRATALAIVEYQEKQMRAIAEWKPTITADTVSRLVHHHCFVTDEDPERILEGDAAARDAVLKRIATAFCRDELRGISSGFADPLGDDVDRPF